MAEIKTPLIELREGEDYVAGPDQYLVTEEHTHSDILRFVVADVGKEHALAILASLPDETGPA